MPTMIYLVNGQKVEVAEEPNAVAAKFVGERRGLPVRFDVPSGDETTVTYVNPNQVTHFEETPPSDERGAPVASGS